MCDKFSAQNTNLKNKFTANDGFLEMGLRSGPKIYARMRTPPTPICGISLGRLKYEEAEIRAAALHARQRFPSIRLKYMVEGSSYSAHSTAAAASQP